MRQDWRERAREARSRNVGGHFGPSIGQDIGQIFIWECRKCRVHFRVSWENSHSPSKAERDKALDWLGRKASEHGQCETGRPQASPRDAEPQDRPQRFTG